jgi:hypothetical protein
MNKCAEHQLPKSSMTAKVIFFWLLACAPLSWGVYQTMIKVAGMFA